MMTAYTLGYSLVPTMPVVRTKLILHSPSIRGKDAQSKAVKP